MGHLARRTRSNHNTRSRIRLSMEELESRVTPSSFNGLFRPNVVAGSSTGSPADSPAARIDPNTTTSYFSGVGSVQVDTTRGTYLGTGSVLVGSGGGTTYVLTAGHMVDFNDDGKFSSKDGILRITFWFNYGGNQTHSLTMSGSALSTSIFVNPNYTGFNHPSVNDDIAILRFNGDAPAGSAAYSIYSGSLDGHVITMVGYGQSGYGNKGYTVGASWSVKHVGQNVVDAYYGQDDAGQSSAKEVFRYDFDGPTSSTNRLGGLTLGNDVEATIGPGDSGGPSFVWIDVDNDPSTPSVPYIAGVNTFTQAFTRNGYGKFGSLGGGMVVGAYVDWLISVDANLGVATAALSSAPGDVPGTGDRASNEVKPTDPVLPTVPALRLPTVQVIFIAVNSTPAAMLLIPAPVVPVQPMLPPVVDATQARTSLGISPATTGTWFYPTDEEEEQNQNAPPAQNQPDNMRPAPAPDRQQDPAVDRGQAAAPAAVTIADVAVQAAASEFATPEMLTQVDDTLALGVALALVFNGVRLPCEASRRDRPNDEQRRLQV